MQYSTDYKTHAAAISKLFEATFSASDSVEEGALIGSLAGQLIADTPPDDLRVVTAWRDDILLGGIFFSRLTYAGDPRTVFMMGPVAVATAHQGQHIGKRLISHGLDALWHQGVDIAVTYGDPAFYGRIGFEPVSEVDIPALHPLRKRPVLAQFRLFRPANSKASTLRCG